MLITVQCIYVEIAHDPNSGLYFIQESSSLVTKPGHLIVTVEIILIPFIS